jgi:exosortase/archaeosortase family protein
MKIEKGFRQFLWKTGIFVLLFIIFSGIIGINLFANGLLTKWKLEIYGIIGYILLFSIAVFILVYRKRLTEFKVFKRKPIDIAFIVLSFILLFAFYTVEKNAGKIALTTINIILVHVLGLSIFVFLVFGIYGWKFIKDFAKKFKKEILYFLIFGIIVYSLMKTVWSLWPYLSAGVLASVKFLLRLIGVEVEVLGPATISVNSFAVQIAEACSGIYSIFIFSALYLFIVFLDWNKMNKTKASLVFIPAVLGAFAFNILRVFALMLVGAYISRNIALGLYHSYSGMIFFLIYFGLFWGLGYKWMKK